MQKEALKTRRGKPVKDACKWIQANDLFKAWRETGNKKSTKKSRRLWISGGPAKGKTFFSLYIVEQLEAWRRKARSNVRICYFFFENDHSTAEEALKAMIGMLLDQIKSSESYESTAETLDRHKADQLTFEPLWTIFCSLVQKKSAGIVFCIVDGLDECRPPSLTDLLRKFSNLFTSTHESMKLRLLVVSQPSPHITAELTKWPRLDLDHGETRKGVDVAIKTFIQSTLDFASEGDISPAATISEVESMKMTLLLKSESNFLWIANMMDELRGKTMKEAKKLIRNAPKGIDASFNNILKKISPNDRGVASNILKYVVAAARPLNLVELGTLADVKGNTRQIEEETQSKVLACGSLLNISPSGHVHLVHSSVKSHLLNAELPKQLQHFRIDKNQVHSEMAQTCFVYAQEVILENDAFRNLRKSRGESEDNRVVGESFEENSKIFPLLDYATRYWIEHCQLGSDDAFKFLAEMEFDKFEPLWHLEWLLRHSHWDYPGDTTLVHFVAEYGCLSLLDSTRRRSNFGKLLWRLLRRLLRAPTKAITRTSYGMTPLHIAARKGMENVVKVLLEDETLKEDLELRGLGLTPLDWAVRNSHDEVARMLLKHGADVESRGLGMTALNWAGWEGRIEFVKELVVRWKASIDARTAPDATNSCLELPNPLGKFVWNTPAEIAFFIESCAFRTAKEDAERRQKDTQAAYTLGIWITFAGVVVVLVLFSTALSYYWAIIMGILRLAGWDAAWWVVVGGTFSTGWLMVALMVFLKFPLAASLIVVLTVAAWAGFASGWALIATAALPGEGGEYAVILVLVREVRSFFIELFVGWIIFALAIWYEVSLVYWICLATVFTSYSSVVVVKAASTVVSPSTISYASSNPSQFDFGSLGCGNVWQAFSAVFISNSVYAFAGLVVIKHFFGHCESRSKRLGLGVVATIFSVAMCVGTILIRPIPTAIRSVTVIQLCRIATCFSALGCITAWILAEGISCIRQRKRRIGTLNSVEGGRNTLQLAASSGHLEVVRFLLEKGAKIDAVDSEMRTALHLAAQNGHSHVVSLLKEKHANLKAEDTDGRTAAQLAEERGHYSIYKGLMVVHEQILNGDPRTHGALDYI
jgi:ankyrin repeat protein